jgi:excisionase family DNA binding protein
MIATEAGWLTRQEAATVLGCHVNSVDRLADDKILTRHRKPGRTRVYFLRAQVESLIEPQPEDTDV